MADQAVVDLLYSWELDSLVEIFQENEITIDILAILSEDLLKELIPKIGVRVKFITKWKSAIGPISETSKVVGVTAGPSSDDLVTWILSSPSTSTTDSTVTEIESQTLVSPESEASSSTPNLNSENHLQFQLLNCNEGQSLLNSYKEKGRLDFNLRKRLCHFIINKELNGDPNVKVSSERLKCLAKEITEIFTGETPETYYVPYFLLGPQKKRNAKGKLVDCLNNKRRDFKKLNPKVVCELNYEEKNEIDDLETDESSHEEDLTWLRNSCDPWHMVETKWKNTIKVRHAKLVNCSNISIEDYLNEFPALKTPKGYLLLASDFDSLYPDSADKLHTNFPLYKENIFRSASDTCDKARDSTIKEMLKDYLSYSKGSIESQNCAALLCLPFLIGTSSSGKRKKGEHKLPRRPSKAEVRDSFLTHIKSSAELEETVKRRRDKCEKLKTTLQPFVVVVGPNLESINSFYVVINNNYYRHHTLLSAVDTCFKLFFSLHVEYPEECAPVWVLLQKGIYKCHTKWDKMYTSVNSLMSDLGMM